MAEPPLAPLRSETPAPRSLLRGISDHLILLGAFLGAMWLVEILDHLPFLAFDRFGIRPRSVDGLLGLFTAPFLHAHFRHLMLNSVPFLILGGAVLLGGLRVFWGVTLFVMVVGGLGVWLLAPANTIHLGASGLIFGYLGYLIARGLFTRSFSAILIGTLILIGYGSLLHGILPGQPGISWQGHLFGLLAGIAAARIDAAFPRNRAMS